MYIHIHGNRLHAKYSLITSFSLYFKFDESGRRISCALSSSIGLRLFSVLDDGSGHVPVETLLYRWMEEGVDNSAEILQVTHIKFLLLPFNPGYP